MGSLFSCKAPWQSHVTSRLVLVAWRGYSGKTPTLLLSSASARQLFHLSHAPILDASASRAFFTSPSSLIATAESPAKSVKPSRSHRKPTSKAPKKGPRSTPHLAVNFELPDAWISRTDISQSIACTAPVGKIVSLQIAEAQPVTGDNPSSISHPRVATVIFAQAESVIQFLKHATNTAHTADSTNRNGLSPFLLNGKRVDRVWSAPASPVNGLGHSRSRVILVCAAPGALPCEADVRQKLPKTYGKEAVGPDFWTTEPLLTYGVAAGGVDIDVMEWRFFSYQHARWFVKELNSREVRQLFDKSAFYCSGMDPCSGETGAAAMNLNSANQKLVMDAVADPQTIQFIHSRREMKKVIAMRSSRRKLRKASQSG